MAYDKVTTLKGSSKSYRLHDDIKRYTLRDNGFQETKTGNFQYFRDVSPLNSNQSVMLKILVSKDLDSLRMSTTTANGLKTLDVYGKANMETVVENINYILASLIEENVIREA